VERCGVAKRGWRRLKNGGSRPSRDDRAGSDQTGTELLAHIGERARQRSLHVDPIDRNHARDDRRNDDVEDRAEDQRSDDADRHVALWVLRFLGGGRHAIEADVRKEHQAGPRHHTGPAERHERLPVRGIDVSSSRRDHVENHGRLEHDDHGIRERALAHADDQQCRDEKDDHECR
jgi:hypothetical protein